MDGLRQFAQLPTVDERFQNVLLCIVVVIDDLCHPLAQLRKVLDIFVDAVIIHVVGGRLGSHQPIIANVLLGKAVPVMTPDHRVGQIEIFDHGLQFTLVFFGHFTSEDRGDPFGLTDIPIQVQQALDEFIHRCPTTEDEVVAILHLGEKQPVLATCLFALLIGKERRERCQPLPAALE